MENVTITKLRPTYWHCPNLEEGGRGDRELVGYCIGQEEKTIRLWSLFFITEFPWPKHFPITLAPPCLAASGFPGAELLELSEKLLVLESTEAPGPALAGLFNSGWCPGPWYLFPFTKQKEIKTSAGTNQNPLSKCETQTLLTYWDPQEQTPKDVLFWQIHALITQGGRVILFLFSKKKHTIYLLPVLFLHFYHGKFQNIQ